MEVALKECLVVRVTAIFAKLRQVFYKTIL